MRPGGSWLGIEIVASAEATAGSASIVFGLSLTLLVICLAGLWRTARPGVPGAVPAGAAAG